METAPQMKSVDQGLFETAMGMAIEYMEGVDERAVFPTKEALADLTHFDEPMPDQGVKPLD